MRIPGLFRNTKRFHSKSSKSNATLLHIKHYEELRILIKEKLTGITTKKKKNEREKALSPFNLNHSAESVSRIILLTRQSCLETEKRLFYPFFLVSIAAGSLPYYILYIL